MKLENSGLIFLFSFGSRKFFISVLISFLTHSSFSNELFNPVEFVYLLEICLLLILSLTALSSKRMYEVIYSF